METGAAGLSSSWHPLLLPCATVGSHQCASLSIRNKRESSRARSLFPAPEGSSSDVPLTQAQGQDPPCPPPLSVPSSPQRFQALSQEPPHIGSFCSLPDADHTGGRQMDWTVKRHEDFSPSPWWAWPSFPQCLFSPS